MKDLAGKIYYGLHFQPGVAEYKEFNEDGSPLRIFVNSETAKRMDATFPGRPVFVRHKDKVTEEDFKEADGYVVESFFNKSDGNHWAKFIVTTEEGEKAIREGWKLSNAYFRKQHSEGGSWHGVDYDQEVTEGEYEHLAIVNDPRYEESVILDPATFKNYNAEKERELERLKNSKERKAKLKKRGASMKFNFFQKQKIENDLDLDSLSVTLPRSNREVDLTSLIQNADDAEMKKGEPKIANGEEKIKVGEEEMTVNELKEKYMQMCKAKNEDDEEKAENEDDEDDKAKNKKAKNKKSKNTDDKDEDDKAENEDEDDKAENEDEDENSTENEDEDDDKDKSMDNEDEDEDDDEEEDDESTKNAFFDTLKNAEPNARVIPAEVNLGLDRLERGKKRYGS